MKLEKKWSFIKTNSIFSKKKNNNLTTSYLVFSLFLDLSESIKNEKCYKSLRVLKKGDIFLAFNLKLKYFFSLIQMYPSLVS